MGAIVAGKIFGPGLDPSKGADWQAAPAPIQQQNGLADNINQQQQQEQTLVDALMARSNGQGPSLAQNQLQAATNANNQQAAGLIASQKGINPALAARLAAEQAGNNNQMAAGQSGMLRANEQLGAQQQLGAMNLQQQQILQGAFNNQNQAINTAYGNATNANAGIAGVNAKNQGQLLGSLGQGAAMMAMSRGGEVPGSAPVQGDSIKNDTVHTMLSPGEIVIPRSHADSPDKAKAFIDELMKTKKSKEPKGYSKVLSKHKELEKRLAKLEKKAK